MESIFLTAVKPLPFGFLRSNHYLLTVLIYSSTLYITHFMKLFLFNLNCVI